MTLRAITGVDPDPADLRRVRMGFDSQDPRRHHPIDPLAQRDDFLDGEAE